MQPNQQDPSQQNMTTSSGANIPEYLHMDPIVDPSIAAIEAKNRLVQVIVILLFIIALSAAAYFVFITNSPQEKFYRSLMNMTTMQAVSRNYQMVSDSKVKSTLSLDIKSDFSSTTAPVSALTYDVSGLVNGGLIKGEQVLRQGPVFDSKLLQSKAMKDTRYSLNKWYAINTQNTSANNLSLFDTMRLREDANSPFGIVSFGFSTKSQSETFIKDLKDKNVYKVGGVKSQDSNGKKYDIYSIVVDTDTLTAVTEKTAKKSKQALPKNTLSINHMNSEMEFWVNQKNEQIEKIVFSTKPSLHNPAMNGEMLIDFATQKSISVPDAQEL